MTNSNTLYTAAAAAVVVVVAVAIMASYRLQVSRASPKSIRWQIVTVVYKYLFIQQPRAEHHQQHHHHHHHHYHHHHH